MLSKLHINNMNLGKTLKTKCSGHVQYSLRLGSPSAGARFGHVAGAGKVTGSQHTETLCARVIHSKYRNIAGNQIWVRLNCDKLGSSGFQVLFVPNSDASRPTHGLIFLFFIFKTAYCCTSVSEIAKAATCKTGKTCFTTEKNLLIRFNPIKQRDRLYSNINQLLTLLDFLLWDDPYTSSS